MIYTEYTKQAMKLAYEAHHGQTDKDGIPYIYHVIHVAEQMTDEISTIAALLHDVAEDTSVTWEDLKKQGFPKEAVEAVRCLTHNPSVPYLDYIRGLRGNPYAVQVKLADLAHNSMESRLSVIDDAARARMQNYQQAMRILRTTEVVAALIWDGSRFMICQRPPQKARGLLWEFVGGKVEPGETNEQALIRECREELDITVDVQKRYMDVTHAYPDLTVHLSLYHASVAQGTPRMLEHAAMAWITPDEIDQYEFCPADVVILDRIRQDYSR